MCAAIFVPLGTDDVQAACIGDPIAEHDVGAAPGHVGRDGHRYCLADPRVGDDVRFSLVQLAALSTGVLDADPCRAWRLRRLLFSMLVVVPTRIG